MTAAEFSNGGVSDYHLVRRIEDRRAAYADWENLLSEIRTLSDLENFLRPPSITDLTGYARDEPIVIVTYGRFRCDALILTGVQEDPVRLVPLREVKIDDIYANAGRLTEACGTRNGRDLAALRAGGNEQIPAILTWLWNAVAEPVLDALGYTRAPRDGEDWPRIRWCPVEAFGVLPLHAAGRYGADGTPVGPDTTVMDRVVSSYTTTVRSLSRVRRPSDSTPASALIVSVPSLPGAELPGAAIEAEAISSLIRGSRQLADATRDAVLDALPDHRIAHFACHVRTDRSEPRRSCLVLMDHGVVPLTIADISALNIRGDLAYLSACDTASTGRRLADESLHLTSAFHLAGYRHVIGTLWPIDDAVAAEFAAEFYAILTDGGLVPPRTERSAPALHRATRHLRERHTAEPWLWAAYTHTGA
jgi:hypothetical protein